MKLTELRLRIADAARLGRRLAIEGGGTKRGIGVPDPGAERISTAGLSGIIDYEPAELVLTLGAGTPLAEAEALLAGNGQMLAFEPFDHGPLFGEAAGRATIGGAIAAGVSGSRRLSAGGARDHLLGFRAISGRGETFVAGAKVVKNVTGYDLPKLMAGSWGRLALLAEVTLKVLPAPRDRASLMIEGLGDREAGESMTRAMRGPFDVAAAAHLPAVATGAKSVTLLRLEGFRPSVDARAEALRGLLGGTTVRGSEETGVWGLLRTLEPFAADAMLWRVVLPPANGWRLAEALAGHAHRWAYDWAGGLLWLATGNPAAPVRAEAARLGGHAMLVRASDEARGALPVFHPEPPAVAALSERVRAAFDPGGVFRTARFGEAIHAH